MKSLSFQSTATFGKILLLANVFGLVVSFTSQQHNGRGGGVAKGVELSMAGESDFLSRISNPFFAKEGSSKEDGSSSGPSGLNSDSSFDTPGAEILVGKAKAVIATDLGVQDPSLLDEDFLWIGPLQEKPLGKVDYLAAGRFFSLRTAFPDLDYRPHDFRIDENDPLTVRCTVRPLGVMRGPLRLRTELVQPNGKQWRGPPEAISMTFDPDTGKLVKLCSGFAIDRLVGNTNGLCGVMAAATIAGVPPSDWEVYPIPAVISRFFGRPVDPVGEVSTFLAPFPETVMIQLVKGILTTNLAADDASLLAKDFSFVTPSIGPIGKNKFLESYAAQEFGGFEPEFSHFRVDPFDPYRVWVDVKPVGPGLEGPPQACSFTFDDDGFCTRMTAGAVMDPSIGNTGGLTGAAGIKYAIGEGDLDVTVRPLPVAIGRLKKTILSPLTKISADDYVLDSARGPSSEDKAALDPVEARKALAEARARIQEEEAQRRQLAMEEEIRLRALQEAEQEKLRLRQEAEEELRQAREEIEREILRREAESRQATQPVVTKEEPTFTIPTTPKMSPPKLPSPPKIAPPKIPALPKMAPPQKAAQSKPPTPKAEPRKPKQAQGNFFADAFKPLSDLSASRPSSISDGDANGKKKKAAADKEKLNEAAATAIRINQQEKLELQKGAAAKQKAEFEEAQKKRAKERKLAAEQKQADLEKRKAAADEARARKAAETSAAIAKRQKEAEEKRLEAEKKRKQAISKGSDAVSGAFSAFQSKPYPFASNKTPESKQPSKPTTPRRSLQIPKVAPKPAPKAPPSAPRPSFQIPQFGKAAAPPKPKSPPSMPRPSFQIPQLGKKPESSSPSGTVPKPTKAPKDTPTIVAWRKNANGGVSGQIFGSMNFKEGERVETSSIASGEVENGSVVTTESGSKYFLSGESVRDMRAAVAKSAPRPQAPTTSKPRATLQLTKNAKERDAKAAQAALEAASKAQSASQQKRPTFSLAALFGMDNPSDSPKTKPQPKTSIPSPKISRSPVAKQAPKGVPSVGRWKQNRDKSITGFISGSASFSDGERVTTSPIAGGVIESGEVVVTSSGSKYFLQ